MGSDENMREIKFRAWDKKLKKMVNNLVYHGDYKCNEGEEIFIVMQFIGLKDKNNKDIYEGDILKIDSVIAANNGNQLVAFEDGCFCLKGCGWGEPVAMYLKDSPIEVIGNIYDNPEKLR